MAPHILTIPEDVGPHSSHSGKTKLLVSQFLFFECLLRLFLLDFSYAYSY